MIAIHILLAASAALLFTIGASIHMTVRTFVNIMVLKVLPLALAFADSFFVVAWIMGWPV